MSQPLDSERDASELLDDWRDGLEAAESVRADLYVRSLGAPVPSQARQETVLHLLDALVDEGTLDEWTVNVWGDRLYADSRCAETAVGRHLAGKLSEFRAWAGDRDAVALDLDPGEVECGITGESYEMVRLPRVALAVYADADLLAVLPCSVGDSSVGVSGFLALALGEPAAPETRTGEEEDAAAL